MKTKEEEYSPVVRRLKEAVENPTVSYTNACILKGKELKPFTTDTETAARISQEKQSLEKKFKSEAELSEIMLNNGKIVFGEKTLLIVMQKQSIIDFNGAFMPDGILIDFTNPERRRIYLINVIISKENFAGLFFEMTAMFSFFNKKENILLFREMLVKVISKNIGLRNSFKKLAGEKAIPEFFETAINCIPHVLLVMDNHKAELNGFMETYTETWGRYVKHMVVKKFAINGDTIITTVPVFSELDNKLNGKRNGNAEKVVKATEEDHLQSTSETMKEIFLELKKELLKTDKELEFRVKQYYISLRKKRNLAFFQLGKKKLSIVIANPDKDTRKQIKHHEIRTLADSVKKFWNGNEYCFTVVIESKEYLSEITQLLKKLVLNGEPPAGLPVRSETKAGAKAGSDGNTPETPKIAHSEKKKATTGKVLSQAKPKRKGRK